jgi:hypothetical protein
VVEHVLTLGELPKVIKMLGGVSILFEYPRVILVRLDEFDSTTKLREILRNWLLEPRSLKPPLVKLSLVLDPIGSFTTTKNLLTFTSEPILETPVLATVKNIGELLSHKFVPVGRFGNHTITEERVVLRWDEEDHLVAKVLEVESEIESFAILRMEEELAHS